MFKVVKKNDGEIRKITDNKTAINIVTKEITPPFSLAILQTTNYNEKETTAYNRIYHVTEGLLILTFDNNRQELSIGDSCYVSQGATYSMSDTFKAFVINQPAFGIK